MIEEFADVIRAGILGDEIQHGFNNGLVTIPAGRVQETMIVFTGDGVVGAGFKEQLNGRWLIAFAGAIYCRLGIIVLAIDIFVEPLRLVLVIALDLF